MLRLLAIVAMFSFAACKNSPGNQSAIAITPERVATDAGAATQTWGELELDDHNEPVQKLVLSLDIVRGEDQSGSMPVCRDPYEFEGALGELVCSDGETQARGDITLKHVSQDCYTDPNFKVIPAESVLRLPGCTRAQVLGHVFEPELRIDIENR